MLPAHPITVSSWDSTISANNIQRGTGLRFSLPPDLIYRQVYFFVQPVIVNVNNDDFFLKGDVFLNYKNTIRASFPASLGLNINNTMLSKSVVNAFANHRTDRNGDGTNVIGSAFPDALHVTLDNNFSYGTWNIVTLAPRRVVCEANEFLYVIEDWSQGPIGSFGQAVTGFRAIGIVISSNAPL